MDYRTRRDRLILLGIIVAGLAFAFVLFYERVSLSEKPVPPAPTARPGPTPTSGPEPPKPRNFFISSVEGQDSNAGTSPGQAWRTFDPLKSVRLAPGDAIYLARGSAWQTSLLIAHSGTAGNPILLSAYGQGPRPVIEPGSKDKRPLTIDGSWIVAEGLLIRNSRTGGINITPNAQHNVIRDMEITEVGIGVEMYGPFNHITGSNIHDLHMVLNTPGGDDDYGALGVLLASHDNEVSYNAFTRCRALSFDYKLDGGAVELYGEGVDNNSVHHNVGIENDGFIEVGGGSARNTMVAYNVSYNSNGRFAWFNLRGKHAAEVEDFHVANNTIVETANAVAPGILWFGSVPPTPRMLQVYNNIFYVNRIEGIANQSGFSHDHNLYFMLNPSSTLGLTLAEGEQVADPLFVDLSRADFRLRSNSPAIKAGRRPDQGIDFLGMPQGEGAPDLGALPYSQGPATG